MPTVYLRKDLYDNIVKAREDVNQFVNKTVENALKPEPEEKIKGKVKNNG